MSKEQLLRQELTKALEKVKIAYWQDQLEAQRQRRAPCYRLEGKFQGLTIAAEIVWKHTTEETSSVD
jgi:hypothetical protein